MAFMDPQCLSQEFALCHDAVNVLENEEPKIICYYIHVTVGALHKKWFI